MPLRGICQRESKIFVHLYHDEAASLACLSFRSLSDSLTQKQTSAADGISARWLISPVFIHFILGFRASGFRV